MRTRTPLTHLCYITENARRQRKFSSGSTAKAEGIKQLNLNSEEILEEEEKRTNPISIEE